MNLYFSYSPLTANTVARAADVNTRFSGVEAGFDLLPPPVYLYEDRITYSVDTGVANAYIATPDIPITAYSEGLRIRLKAAHNNSGVSTLNVSGLGVKQIVRADGTPLQLNDIVAGQILDLTYDGTAFRLSLAFAEISPAGVMAKIAAGGNMVVNGSVTATALIVNGQTLDALAAFGVSLAEAANAPTARTLLGLGTVATHDFSEFLTSAALTAYAPLASPALTGVPTAPTAADNTNTTQLATTAYVVTRVSTAVTGLAPLASPGFTGVPTSTTPATADNTTKIATTAYVQSNLTAYAPLASPALSGTPTAPTAAPGTNTTQIASTAYVTAAVAAGGGGGGAPLDSPAFTGNPTAPTQLTSNNSTRLATTAFVQANVNGLAPLASPGFSGTPTAPTAATATNTTQIATTAYVKANLASYALLASPALTGTPTAPTAAGGNNTTQVATTAYVQGELGGKANAFLGITNFTTARTITDSDNNDLLRFTGTIARTITLNATPTAGFSCILANRGTVNLTLAAASGEYLNGGGATVTSITLAPSGKVTLVHEGSGVWTVDGTGAT